MCFSGVQYRIKARIQSPQALARIPAYMLRRRRGPRASHADFPLFKKWSYLEARHTCVHMCVTPAYSCICEEFSLAAT